VCGEHSIHQKTSIKLKALINNALDFYFWV